MRRRCDRRDNCKREIKLSALFHVFGGVTYSLIICLDDVVCKITETAGRRILFDGCSNGWSAVAIYTKEDSKWLV